MIHPSGEVYHQMVPTPGTSYAGYAPPSEYHECHEGAEQPHGEFASVRASLRPVQHRDSITGASQVGSAVAAQYETNSTIGVEGDASGNEPYDDNWQFYQVYGQSVDPSAVAATETEDVQKPGQDPSNDVTEENYHYRNTGNKEKNCACLPEPFDVMFGR